MIKILDLRFDVTEPTNNPLLPFIKKVTKDGELLDDETCKVKSLGFSINRQKKTNKLHGSIHKFWNDGHHNYNDFRYSDLVNTLLALKKDFKINLKESRLNNLEFGVNLSVDFDPTDCISDIIRHRKAPFKPILKGIGVSGRHSQYSIKIYNKSFQYQLPYHVLRIEIKVETMDYFRANNIKISALSDLMNIDTCRKLGENLIKRFKEIMFYDSMINTDVLSHQDQLILSNARIPKYWTELESKYEVDTLRRKYNRLFQQHVKRDWKKIIIPLIQDKLNDIIVEFPLENRTEIAPEIKTLVKEKTLVEPIPEISSSVFRNKVPVRWLEKLALQTWRENQVKKNSSIYKLISN